MTPGGWLVAGVCVLIVGYCAVVFAVALFADWAQVRESERTAAASFDADYIAEAEDVIAQEHALLEAVLVSELERVELDWQAHVRDVRAWAREA